MVKGEGPAQKRIGDAADAPYITSEVIRLLLQDFRGNIAQCAERFITSHGWSDDSCQPEIYNPRDSLVSIIRHHYVLKFQITMNDAILLEILNGHR